jgi:hypothetical protein
MPTLYHYTPLFPLREEYRDDGSQVILSIPCEITGTRISEICLLGTDQTVFVIRITITSLTERTVSKEEERKITELVEHMLGVLRLTYDLEADFIRHGNSYLQMTHFGDEGQPLNFQFKIWYQVFRDFKVDVGNVGAVFCKTAKMKEDVRLCTDALHATLPLQYRYLSLYKLFERDFKKAKQWREREFKKLLKPFEDEFRALKLTRMELLPFIIDLRNKCAHIVLGQKNNPGILGLASPDAGLVEAFMPLFWKIVAHHLNQKYSGVFETSVFPIVPPQRAAD